MGQNVSYMGILEYVEGEFQRVVKPETPRYVTHRELLQFILPTGCKLNFYHIPTLYVIDRDRDGVFSLQDLQLFAGFVAEVSSREAELLQTDYGELIQSMCLLKMRHDHLGQHRPSQLQQVSKATAIRKGSSSVTAYVGRVSKHSSHQLSPKNPGLSGSYSPNSTGRGSGPTRHRAADWLVTFLSRMYPEQLLQPPVSVEDAATSASNTSARAGASATSMGNVKGGSSSSLQPSSQSGSPTVSPRDVLLDSARLMEVSSVESASLLSPLSSQSPCLLASSAPHRFGQDSLYLLYQLLSKGTDELPVGGDFGSFFDSLVSCTTQRESSQNNIKNDINDAGITPNSSSSANAKNNNVVQSGAAPAAAAAAAATSSSSSSGVAGSASKSVTGASIASGEAEKQQKQSDKEIRLATSYIAEPDLTQFLTVYFNSVFETVDMLGLRNMSVRPGD